MKRQLLFSCLTAALWVVPCATRAQDSTKPAEQSKPAQQAKPAAPAAEAAKPAGEPKNVVKSATFADVDFDGQIDVVLAYELLGEDVQLTRAAEEVASYIQLVARIEDGGIGASLSPASEALQAQLKLTKGQGLVVTKVNADSAAAKAGLQADDILLSAGDRPLAKPSDVSDVLKSPVKKPFTVEFDVLRAGERRKVPVTVTEDTAAHTLQRLAIRTVLTEPSFRIGVEVSDADSTLRTQLKLPKYQGIVIDRVLPESPAQKAGFQQHDVLVAVDGKPLAKSEDLSAAVKASAGKALKFSLLRGGQPSAITVTPEKRDEHAYRVRTRTLALEALRETQTRQVEAQRHAVLADWLVRNPRQSGKPSGDTSAQIQHLLKQIDDLRASVKALEATTAEQSKVPLKPAPSKTDLPKSEPPK